MIESFHKVFYDAAAKYFVITYLIMSKVHKKCLDRGRPKQVGVVGQKLNLSLRNSKIVHFPSPMSHPSPKFAVISLHNV